MYVTCRAILVQKVSSTTGSAPSLEVQVSV